MITTTRTTPARRRASEALKTSRATRIASLLAGLTGELDQQRHDSLQARAIACSLRTHHNGMVQYIAARLKGELNAVEARDVARLVAHFDAQEEPQAWETVARHHVDRVAQRALPIGMLLYRMHHATEAAAEREDATPLVAH
jgi:hypothetical protein